MCLILFSYDSHPDYHLVLAANRDEYYERPTAPLHFWSDSPEILAGRDLKGNGAWMGVTRTGRIAAITNYREPGPPQKNAPSRGDLVVDYLRGGKSAPDYLDDVRSEGDRYNGFNLIAGTSSHLYYYGNRGDAVHRIRPGCHGLSNHLLDTPWPKAARGVSRLKALLSREKPIDVEEILTLLSDRTHPPDSALPDTGVSLEFERLLSPMFITSDFYGARSSSVLLVAKTGNITFVERTWLTDGSGAPAAPDRTFSFQIRSADNSL